MTTTPISLADKFMRASRDGLDHTERVLNVDAFLAYAKPEAQRWIWRNASRSQMDNPDGISFLQALERAISLYLDAHPARSRAAEYDTRSDFLDHPTTDLRADR